MLRGAHIWVRSMISVSEVLEFLKNQSIGIGGIILTIGIFKYQTKKKIPCYGIRSTNIIENLDSKFENIEMNYLKNGVVTEKIKDLTVTKVIFWNEGKETIHQNDIATAKPLQIMIKNKCKIISSKIIYTKKSENLFEINLSEDNSYIDVNFEYIDKNEGIVIQILHTGRSRDDILYEGALKGCKLKYRNLVRTKKVVIPLNLPIIKSKEIAFDFIPWYFSLMSIMLIIPILRDYLNQQVVLGQLYITIFMILCLASLMYLDFRRRIPTGFEIFGEDI